MVLEKVKEVIAEHLDCDVNDITEASTFESLGIDSLDTVEMVMDLEDQLGISIEVDKKLETVGELVEFIEAIQAK
jgi:acyl carrier protein